MMKRELIFQGSFNTRDLGGIPNTNGMTTRWRSIIRSDEIDHFTSDGWEKLDSYGIRTVIDLRNENEVQRIEWPSNIHRTLIPLDGADDPLFWNEWKDTGKWCTPLYYEV